MPVDAGTIYSEVRIELDKLRGDIKKMNVAFDRFAAQNKQNTSTIQNNWTKTFKGINLAGTAAIGALTLAFKQAISTFAKTEQSLANVRAVTGATEEEFESLKVAVEEAGRTTRFTASQAADAMFYLASAGFDATESVEALNGVLLLAGATGSDLAQSAQAVTSTLSQFNLVASDSEKVVNIFAAANSNSQATLEKLQGALRQVGPVAGGMNKTLEETVGVLQLLFNAGFQGENAGRALKSALADLGNESSQANKKLADLGISFDQVNPATNDLADVFGVLADAGLETADVLDIFGKVAGPQVSVLISEGRESIEEYTEAVTDTNEAARQYAVQNDTLAGSFDKFKSALEGTTNSIIEELAPAFRTILDAAAALLNFITSLPSPIKALGGALGGAAVAVGVLSKAMGLLGIASTAALGPIGLIAGAVIGVGLIISKATKEYRELAKAGKELSKAQEVNITQVDKLRKEYQALAEKEELSAEEKVRQKELIEELKLALPGLTEEQIKDANSLNDATLERAKYNKQLAEQAKATYEARKAIVESELIEALSSLEDQYRSMTGVLVDEETPREAFEQWVWDVAPGVLVLKGEVKDLTEAIDSANGTIDEANIVIDEYNKSLEENTENLNENSDANGANETAVQRQIRIRKEAEANLAAITARINKERELGLISEEEKIRQIISANEDLVRSLLDVDYTGLTSELGDQAIRRSLDLIKELNEELNKEVDIEEKLRNTLEAVDRQREIGLISQKQLLEERIRAYEEFITAALEAEDFDEQLLKGYVQKIKDFREQLKQFDDDEEDGVVPDYKSQFDINLENYEKFLDDLTGLTEEEREIWKGVFSDILTGAKNLFSALNDIYQTDKENQIKAVEDKVEQGILAEEEGEKQIRQLKYEARLRDWENQGFTIGASIAEAIARAIGSAPWPANLPAVAFATATGAAQVINWTKNKPKLQTGGVVLPSSGGRGTDAILAENGSPELAFNLGASGEPFINLLADKISERIGGGGSMRMVFNFNGRTFAEGVVEYINNGEVELEL